MSVQTQTKCPNSDLPHVSLYMCQMNNQTREAKAVVEAHHAVAWATKKQMT